MIGVLSGLKVLDLTFYLPGPYATLFLADLGAEVIKVENPAGGDPLRGLGPDGGSPAGSVLFRALNRGKKSVTLDLKTAEGRASFLKLAATADAVLEQFRPGVAPRLGIGYEATRAVNPRITYVSLTGYGQTGPLAGEAGHDLNYMARSGLLSLFREGDRLPLPPIQIADLNGGNLAAIALLAGMLSARLTGEGRYVDVSMTDGLFALLGMTVANHLAAGGRPPERRDLFLAGNEPFYNVYVAADGRFLAVGALEPKFWANLCAVLAENDPEGKPAEVIGASQEETARVFASRPSEDWLARFDGLDVCVTPVLTVAEALGTAGLGAAGPGAGPSGGGGPSRTGLFSGADYVKARGLLVEAGTLQIGPPLAVAGAGGPVGAGAHPAAATGDGPGQSGAHGRQPRTFRPAPALGEHNDEILGSL